MLIHNTIDSMIVYEHTFCADSCVRVRLSFIVRCVICFAQVWLMLKSELMAPATVEAQTPDQLFTGNAAAKAAAAALTQCITALGPGYLDQKVLSDVILEDLMQYLGLVNPPWSQKSDESWSRKGDESAPGPGVTSAAEWDLPDRAQKRLVCIARVVAAVRDPQNDQTLLRYGLSCECRWRLHAAYRCDTSTI